MKASLLVFFLVSFNLLFSQTYKPLLQDGNKWYTSFHSSNGPCGNPSPHNSFIYQINGDSLVNGASYKKIYCKALVYPKRSCNDNLYTYPLTSKGYLVALLREDTAQKKVYKNQLGTGTEYLLYDFSVQVNDVIDISHFDINNGVPTATINSIDYGNVFGQTNVKRFNPSFGQDNVIYEGIGSNTGLLESPIIAYNWEIGNMLDCFEDVNGKSCVHFFLETQEQQKKKKSVQLYFSKSDHTFKVISPKKESFTITFYSLSGGLVEEKKIDSNIAFTIKNNTEKLLLYTISDKYAEVKGKIFLE
ncbi:hypothetical protein [Chryseobacterium sp. ON_d1]|uniref:hypothetical protein n=1 Tax=Chryseobacterium sp. ON_d1 TaxID=2583211 RepID=UPI00115B9987|nr:hypothetical protein [Chryseobacterium sp. ON_d1]GEJ47251.1 hypothetical protein CRS_38590 [Chryseobacterium sp. ON_d1]